MGQRRNTLISLKRLLSTILLSCIAIFAAVLYPAPARTEIASDQDAASRSTFIPPKDYGKIPLHFEPNVGQTEDEVKFFSRAKNYEMYFTNFGATLHLRELSSLSGKRSSKFFGIKFGGADSGANVAAESELAGKTNYLIGNDRSKWKTGIPNYGKIRYNQIYHGIDVVFYGDQENLEYDFIIQPRVSPEPISLEFSGVEKAEIIANGDLILRHGTTRFRWKKPFAYQDVGNERREIEASFVVENSGLAREPRVGFQIGDYDRELPLVIDPVLSYSSYLGGDSETIGNGVAVDSIGNAYIAGQTTSTSGFPLVSPFVSQNPGGNAAFVTKINASGTAFVYSTYLTGPTLGNSTASSIAVDPAGNAYVAGLSQSCNFPTTVGSYLPVVPNCAGNPKGFVVKLNPSGSGLAYGTYLSSPDFLFNGELTGIALDSSNNTYITGWTQTASFPTTPGAFKRMLAPNTQNAFVSKLSSSGSTLVYSTFIGINTPVPNTDPFDKANAIAVDSSGNAYITGQTVSQNFPVTNTAFQTFPGSRLDAFVTKLNPNGTGLVYSTYLGGNGDEIGRAIAVDAGGNAYVTGFFDGTNGFPFTPNAFRNGAGENCCSSVQNGFLTKIDPTGTALVYSTSLGTERQAMSGTGVAVDSTGSAFVVGGQGIGGAYVVNAIQPVSQNNDAFVLKMNPAGTAFAYSTNLGGINGNSIGHALAIDPSGAAYVTGLTTASNFLITPGAALVNKPGGQSSSSFVTKIATSPTDCPAITIEPQPLARVVFGQNYNQPLTASGGTGPYTFLQAPGFGSNNLPSGLQLSTNGVISGTPSNRNFGSYIVTIQAFDANGCMGIRTFNLPFAETSSGFTINIVGRDTILRDRENRYTFIYTNESNADAFMVPLLITIPSYFTWRPDFSPLETIQPLVGPSIDYSQQPLEHPEGARRGISILLPIIRARSSGSVSIVISTPNSLNFQIDARLAGTLVSSVSEGSETANLRAIAARACNFMNTPGEVCESRVANFTTTQAASYLGAPGSANGKGSFYRMLIGAFSSGVRRPVTTDGSLDAIIQDAAIDALSHQDNTPDNVTAHDTQSGSVVDSYDPNDKAGPSGVGSARYFAGNVPLPYIIYFENLATATAPAKEIVITDQLDPSTFDLQTFAFGDVTIANERITPASSRTVLNKDFDLRPANNIIARIRANLDLQTGRITWRLSAIDPATGEPTDEPLAGILPPNTTPPRGEGSVAFRVRLRSNVPNGTQINNQARIVFDTNAPIDTSVWSNTVDSSAPTSSVQSLPGSVPPSFTVSWGGSDSGSGIDTYSVYVSDNGGPFMLLSANTNLSNTIFNGQVGHTYGFYSIATDATGNREGPKMTAEATTIVNAAQPTIAGRVFTPAGTALRNARVTLTDSTGTARFAVTSSFGVYQFADIVPGQTYTLSVSSKRYRFAPQILPITTSVTNVDFIGLE